jgi:hypothetical protein
MERSIAPRRWSASNLSAVHQSDVVLYSAGPCRSAINTNGIGRLEVSVSYFPGRLQWRRRLRPLSRRLPEQLLLPWTRHCDGGQLRFAQFQRLAKCFWKQHLPRLVQQRRQDRSLPRWHQRKLVLRGFELWTVGLRPNGGGRLEDSLRRLSRRLQRRWDDRSVAGRRCGILLLSGPRHRLDCAFHRT